jgi:hypothetical protein
VLSRGVVSAYQKRTGIEFTPHLEIDNFAMAISGRIDARRGSVAGLGREFPTLLRKAAERIVEATWKRIGAFLQAFTPTGVCQLLQKRRIRFNLNGSDSS